MTGDDQTRVGTSERERASASLADHFAAGRLDADEYEDRRGKAGDAVVQSDLDALVTDLPSGPATSGTVAPPQPGRQRGSGQPDRSSDPQPQRRQDQSPGLAQRRKVGQGAVALAPFVGLALFFITDSWLWFLLIPVTGIVYGLFANDSDDD